MKKAKKKPKNNSAAVNIHKPDKAFMDEVEKLLYYAPPAELSRHLRKVFMGYLEHEQGGLPVDFNDLLADLYLLF